MEVRHRQELGFALGQPLACGSALTRGAVPIAAAIVGDDGVSAGLELRTGATLIGRLILRR